MASVAKLTVGRIGTLTPEAKDFILYEDSTPGFGVRVYPSGRRCYVFRYRARQRGALLSRMVTIADDRKVGLDDARRIARDLAGQVARGEDPSQERAKAKTAGAAERSFAEVREDFLKQHVDAKLRPSTAREYKRVLERQFAKLDRKAFVDVTQDDIADALRSIADRGKIRSANLARAYVRKLYSWARAKQLCAVNIVKETERAGADERRERVLSREEIGEIYRAALTSGDAFGALVRFLMLTGQRRSEVFEMTDDEVDEAGKLWRLSGSRTKNKKPHEIPLSTTCLRIMAARPRVKRRVPGKGRLVFATTTGMVVGNVDKAKKKLDRAISDSRREADPKARPLPHWTLHDLRRSFVTHAHGELGVPLPVLERAINHISGTFGGVVGIYNRAPLMKERVAAFEAWEAFVLDAAGLKKGHAEIVKARGEAA